jgi:centromere protein S
MLLTRRNDALETMLRKELEGMKAAEGRVDGGGGAAEVQGQGKKRGRPAGKGKGKA